MTEVINLFSPLPFLSRWLIGVLLTILSGAIIYGVKIYLSASKEFLNTIYTELEGLYPTPTKWPLENGQIEFILKEKFPRLEAAVHKFRGHLPTCMVKRFNKAWTSYYNEHGRSDWQCYFHYMPFSGTSIEKWQRNYIR